MAEVTPSENFDCKYNPQLELMLDMFTASIDLYLDPFRAGLSIPIPEFALELDFLLKLQAKIPPAFPLDLFIDIDFQLPSIAFEFPPGIDVELPGLPIPNFDFGIDFVLKLFTLPLELMELSLDPDFDITIALPEILVGWGLTFDAAINLSSCLIDLILSVLPPQPFTQEEIDEKKEEEGEGGTEEP
tara:strand:- start:359 stop:919 length:561 start_codon:yes stop_codon:yes gene_type:complete